VGDNAEGATLLNFLLLLAAHDDGDPGKRKAK
jgi:hypothetical protein